MPAGQSEVDARWRSFFRDEAASEIDALADEYPDRRSLYVDLLDLHRYDPDFTRALFANPDRFLVSAADVLGETDGDFERVNVRVENNPGLLGVDGVRIRHHRELVTVEGVVADTDPVHARVRIAVFDCPECGASIRRRPVGVDLDPPSPCPECDGTVDVRLDRRASAFVDAQRLILVADADDDQHSLPVYLDDDIVGSVAVEQEIRATGVIRLRQSSEGNRFTFYLDAVGVNEERPGTVEGADDEGNELQDLIESRWEFVVES